MDEIENFFDTLDVDLQEIVEYFGEPYEKLRKEVPGLYKKLNDMLSKEQRDVLKEYLFTTMFINIACERYYYIKGFEAGRKTQLNDEENRK